VPFNFNRSGYCGEKLQYSIKNIKKHNLDAIQPSAAPGIIGTTAKKATALF
jgi:hypothetical protein